MKELHLDLETRSSVDINRGGMYKYASSPDFDILLLGYSIDGGNVTVIDLTSRESVPEEVLRAIASDHVIKWAHNSSFERVALSYWLRRHRPDLFVGYGIDVCRRAAVYVSTQGAQSAGKIIEFGFVYVGAFPAEQRDFHRNTIIII